MGISTPVELLADLARCGATIRASEGGGVEVDIKGGSQELRQACQRWLWVLIWGLHGAETGHRWYVCDSCGSIAPWVKKPRGTCIITFGCKGHSIDIPQPRFAPGAPHVVRDKQPAFLG